MITDPSFYYVAVPAILLVGIAKAGFCGPLSMLGVPLLALVISPVQAAAIFLPILVLQDLVGLYAYRGKANWAAVRSILPFAIIGIGLGWLIADRVDEDVIRLLVGLTALIFVLDYLWRQYANRPIRTRGVLSAAVWGSISGFTSFIAHVGNPPYQIHMLPLRLPPVVFAATTVHVFTAMNSVKLVPYFALGQFSSQNLTTTLLLAPLAPVATVIGLWLVKKVKQETFYRLTYITMFLIALKLCHDSLAAIL